MNRDFEIGERVRTLRKEHHLTQEQLAFATGITTAYLGQIERNEKNPTILVVAKMCDALGIRLSDFFSEGPFSEPDIDVITLQILNQIKDQDDEVKGIILHISKRQIFLRIP